MQMCRILLVTGPYIVGDGTSDPASDQALLLVSQFETQNLCTMSGEYLVSLDHLLTKMTHNVCWDASNPADQHMFIEESQTLGMQIQSQLC